MASEQLAPGIPAIPAGPIAWFAHIGLADRLAVGGKGASLGELTRAGIAVPPGFVVTAGAFGAFLARLEASAPVRDLVEALAPDDHAAATALSQALRQRVLAEPLPADLQEALQGAYKQLCADGHPVAVRSSATSEDGEDASFAGLQDTFLWVTDAATMAARVRACWASLYSVESMLYRRRLGLPEADLAMAVVIQRMVDARCAGVMFTRSPTTGDKSVITIEGAWGLGSAVVSGEVTPDRWVVGKITGEISVREISAKLIREVPAPGGGVAALENPPELRFAPCLDDGDLMSLREVGRRIEKHYGRPQDIEWAIDQDGRVLLLQARPETVWARRDALAPIAPPAENPLAHVLALLGGAARS